VKYPKLSLAIAFGIAAFFLTLAAGCGARAASAPPAKSAVRACGTLAARTALAAAAMRPYTSEYPATLSSDPWHPYQEMNFSRPRTITKAVTLHNPAPRDAIATVSCPGVTRNFFVRAGGERHFLQDMSSIHLHENACVVDFFHFAGTPGPAADL
jgi:hypothetical protein